MVRPAGMRSLPEPAAGGSIGELRNFVNIAREDDFKLLVAWLLAALHPKGPYAILKLAGEPGAAKTTAARTLRALADPAHVPLRAPPKDTRDLFIAAANSAVVT
jgi:Mg-chelatase subunit ChlI